MDSARPAGEQEYAGQRLGLPREGSGSVAGWGLRVVALFVDWIASLLVADLLAAMFNVAEDTERILPLLVFLAQVTLFTGLTGSSFGQLTFRIVVVRLDGGQMNILTALVRTMLICLVIPPLIFNRDNRGLHDLAVKTVALRR